MTKIDPPPPSDMTEEEARAYEWFVLVQAPSTTARKGIALAKYIDRHRAVLTTPPPAGRANWNCSNCRYENAAGFTKCVMCGAPLMQTDIFPDLPVLIALASIAVHVDEFTTPGQGHPFDLEAIKSLLSDPALKSWMEKMDSMAFLPKKRK